MHWIKALMLAGLISNVYAAFDTTVSVNAVGSATPTSSGADFTATGTATVSGFGTAAFSASGQVRPVQSGDLTGPVSGPFKLDFSNGNTLVGTYSIPSGILLSFIGGATTGAGSLTVTGGTGTLAGTTGSF